MFHWNKELRNFKFPEVPFPETLNKRYGKKESKNCLDLLGNLLNIDENKRSTAKEAL